MRNGDIKSLRLLYRKYSSLLLEKDEMGQQAIRKIGGEDHLEILIFILPSIETYLLERDNKGKTFLQDIVERGNLCFLEYILDYYREVKIRKNHTFLIKDVEKNNLLHIAAENNQYQVARFLYEKIPILLNQKNERGESPLFVACKNENYSVAKVLYRNNKLYDQTNKNNENILHVVLGRNSFCDKMINFIQFIEPSISDLMMKKDKFRRTALIALCQNSHTGDEKYYIYIVNMLIKKLKGNSAKRIKYIFPSNSKDLSPIMEAKSFGKKKISKNY